VGLGLDSCARMETAREATVPADPRDRVTDIVSGLEADAATARVSAEELFPLVYDELRRLAGSFMAREPVGHTLQPTALVHEAYLKLVDQTRTGFTGRTHFLAVGAQVMRRLLIDHARKRAALKRGLGWRRVTLGFSADPSIAEALSAEELLSIDAALNALAELDERQARIVTLRFFGGLNVEEVAEAVGVSKRTVESDWRHARAWLRVELSRGGSS
jgi:RNA polymerase sigma-70 factor (ECF subfamily)